MKKKPLTIEEHARIKMQLRNTRNDLTTISVRLLNAYTVKRYDTKAHKAVLGVDRLRWLVEGDFAREFPEEDYASIEKRFKL